MNPLWLLPGFQVKHFLADYVLQTRYMLGKFAPSWRHAYPPLAAHCGVHAAFTFFMTGPFVGLYWALILAGFDFVTHFIIDRVKASPNLLGIYSHTQPQFWWMLGGDQMLHHLVHYAIVAVTVLRYS